MTLVTLGFKSFQVNGRRNVALDFWRRALGIIAVRGSGSLAEGMVGTGDSAHVCKRRVLLFSSFSE